VEKFSCNYYYYYYYYFKKKKIGAWPKNIGEYIGINMILHNVNGFLIVRAFAFGTLNNLANRIFLKKKKKLNVIYVQLYIFFSIPIKCTLFI
jgi:hypothetical protein